MGDLYLEGLIHGRAYFRNFTVPSYLQNNFKLHKYHIHNYKTRKSEILVLEKVNLKCTQQSSFYKGTTIFNNINKS